MAVLFKQGLRIGHTPNWSWGEISSPPALAISVMKSLQTYKSQVEGMAHSLQSFLVQTDPCLNPRVLVSNHRQIDLTHLWMLQLAWAGGTITAEMVPKCCFGFCSRQHLGCMWSHISPWSTSVLHTTPRHELEHKCTSSHLTNAIIAIMAVKGKQLLITVCKSNIFHMSLLLPLPSPPLSLPTRGFCLLVLHSLANRCGYLAQQAAGQC